MNQSRSGEGREIDPGNRSDDGGADGAAAAKHVVRPVRNSDGVRKTPRQHRVIDPTKDQLLSFSQILRHKRSVVGSSPFSRSTGVRIEAGEMPGR